MFFLLGLVTAHLSLSPVLPHTRLMSKFFSFIHVHLDFVYLSTLYRQMSFCLNDALLLLESPVRVKSSHI